jgi:hypothetical protein
VNQHPMKAGTRPPEELHWSLRCLVADQPRCRKAALGGFQLPTSWHPSFPHFGASPPSDGGLKSAERPASDKADRLIGPVLDQSMVEPGLSVVKGTRRAENGGVPGLFVSQRGVNSSVTSRVFVLGPCYLKRCSGMCSRVGFGDLVADFASQTASGLWQVHVGCFPGRAQAFGCRNVPYCLLAATAAAACPMTRIAAIMGHGPRLTRRTPARARSGISGTPWVTMMLTGRGVS